MNSMRPIPTAILRTLLTLTLDVRAGTPQNYTFYVGQDMNYSSNGNAYPLIKLYKTKGFDEKGADYIGKVGNTCIYREDGVDPSLYESVQFLDSLFTNTLNSTTGNKIGNYNEFYASLAPGKYSFRAYGRNPSTGEYNVYLGGHSLTLPTETNVDEAPAAVRASTCGCIPFYTTSRKTDNTYFTASDYTARISMPKHGRRCAAWYAPILPAIILTTPLHAVLCRKRSPLECLWNPSAPVPRTTSSLRRSTTRLPPDTRLLQRTWRFSQAINLTVTVPAYADFNLFFQYNNFNTQIIEPKTGSTSGDANASADATRTLTYKISKSNSSTPGA